MIVRPFRALRPRDDLAEKIASPPYDVLSSDEARELVLTNPLSFLRVNKPEVDFPSGKEPDSKQIMQRGLDNLTRLVSEGSLQQDTAPCFYVYRLTWREQSQTGLVVTCSVSEYDDGLIKKHEKTRPAKVSDRADHIQTVGAQVGPVFSIFRQTATIEKPVSDETAKQPAYNFETPDGVRHEVWVIETSENVTALQQAFDAMPEMYIADGHHRSEAASEVRRREKEANSNHTGDEGYNFFLQVIFPHDQVRILPYNRVVKGLNNLTPEVLITKLEAAISVRKSDAPVEPDEAGTIGMYLDGAWYELRLPANRKDGLGPADAIDSALLTTDILEPLLGIGDIRTDDRIDFVGGIRGVSELEKLVNSGKYDVAFSLSAVSVDELLAVADAGEVMPPKSTWFEPKLRSGLFIHKLDD